MIPLSHLSFAQGGQGKVPTQEKGYNKGTPLFFLICFSSLCQICQRVVLLNPLVTKMNPNCLLFYRERERKSPMSSREGVFGWCDGSCKIFRAEASY